MKANDAGVNVIAGNASSTATSSGSTRCLVVIDLSLFQNGKQPCFLTFTPIALSKLIASVFFSVGTPLAASASGFSAGRWANADAASGVPTRGVMKLDRALCSRPAAVDWQDGSIDVLASSEARKAMTAAICAGLAIRLSALCAKAITLASPASWGMPLPTPIAVSTPQQRRLLQTVGQAHDRCRKRHQSPAQPDSQSAWKTPLCNSSLLGKEKYAHVLKTV
jgi:hypothetical protein